MVGETGLVSRLGGFLFPNLFRSFRMAIQPSKLALAFLALTAICLTGWLMDLGRTVVTNDRVAFPRSLVGAESTYYLAIPAAYGNPNHQRQENDRQVGVFGTLWTIGDRHFHQAVVAIISLEAFALAESIDQFIRTLIWTFRHHPIYSIIFFAVVLVILSLAGGAICRIAALQFARNERIGLMQAVKFSRRRVSSLIAAPIGPFAIALVLGLPIILLGLVGNIPYAGELLTAILLPLALVVAPFIAVILIGGVAGSNLMFPAIAYEDSDFFDAVSRAFSSVYAKPWRLSFYTLVTVVYGAVCYAFVRFFVFILLWATHGFLRLGLHNPKLEAIWTQPDFYDLVGTVTTTPDTGSLWLAALLVRVWLLAVVGLMISFVISFFFSASTIIYSLMRNRVDGTPLDEVYGDLEEMSRDLPRPGASAQAQAHVAEGKEGEGPEQTNETSQ